LGGGEEGEREEREKGIRGVVLGWGSHVNSFAKLAQVTDAQNKACVKRSRVLFRGTPKIVYTNTETVRTGRSVDPMLQQSTHPTQHYLLLTKLLGKI
jgi:hypothetical protein